jgi:hypothetical protein
MGAVEFTILGLGMLMGVVALGSVVVATLCVAQTQLLHTKIHRSGINPEHNRPRLLRRTM